MLEYVKGVGSLEPPAALGLKNRKTGTLLANFKHKGKLVNIEFSFKYLSCMSWHAIRISIEM